MYRIALPKTEIDAIFANAQNQSYYVMGLYNAAIDNFNQVEFVDFACSVNRVTSDYIWQKAIEFDKQHHPDVVAGGAWMNRGFSIDKDIGDWVVDVDERKITWKTD